MFLCMYIVGFCFLKKQSCLLGGGKKFEWKKETLNKRKNMANICIPFWASRTFTWNINCILRQDHEMMNQLWSLVSWDISKPFHCLFLLFPGKSEPPWELTQHKGLQTRFCIKTFVFPSVSPPPRSLYLFYFISRKRISLLPDSRNHLRALRLPNP